MIMQKTALQEKFNKISEIQDGNILMFNNSNQLVPVNPLLQGIKPQIKVIATNATNVTCQKSGVAGNISYVRDPVQTGVWYFNVPELATYQITATYSGGTTVQLTIQVNEYKQYTVNATNRGS